MAFLSWYFACRTVGTENTKSSSSKVRALVSGNVNRTAAHPTVGRNVKLVGGERKIGADTDSCTKRHSSRRHLGV